MHIRSLLSCLGHFYEYLDWESVFSMKGIKMSLILLIHFISKFDHLKLFHRPSTFTISLSTKRNAKNGPNLSPELLLEIVARL